MKSEHAIPDASGAPQASTTPLSSPSSPDLAGLWSKVLGDEADPGQSFLANGGDSYRAVLLSAEIFELTGREIDYLDILGAEGLTGLQQLIRA